MRGIIPDTLARLKSKNFTPNMEHEIWLEENERSYLQWCREPEQKQKISIAGLPSLLYERQKTRAWKWYSFLIP